MVEKYIKSNMCMLPWTSIETRPDGGYKPCCLYSGELKDPNGIKYNTKQHSIMEVMNSPAMEELRSKFLAGEKPVECDSCWKEEDSNKLSKRQHMWMKAPVIGQTHINKNTISPCFIDLKLGNICNLKCRICAPNSSSQWVNDMIKLEPDRKNYWQQFNKDGLWPREENEFYKDLEKHIESIRFFEITGGEPLMIKEQFAILRKCIDAGVADKIEIHYNTNGTQYPEEAVKDIWPHFKRVEIAFSIDDIGNRFQYQRHPAVWNEVNENIKRFKNSGMKNLSTQICTTLNLFNIYYLAELAYKVKDWTPDFWHINILHHPIEFDIQQIPDKIKLLIIDNLQKCQIYTNEIQSAINYIKNKPSYVLPNWQKAVTNRIKSIDTIREENFATVFPELNKFLKIYE